MGLKLDIDPDKVAQHAGKISKGGMKVSKAFCDAYKAINGMRSDWWGPNYDDLVTAMNGLVANFNEMSDTLTVRIPESLQTALNNYTGGFHDPNKRSVSISTPQKLQELAKTNKTTYNFDETKVTTNQNTAESQFENAKNIIDTEIMTAINSIKNAWHSPAADSAYKTIKGISDKVKANTDEIKKALHSSMAASSQDVKSADSSSTYQ